MFQDRYLKLIITPSSVLEMKFQYALPVALSGYFSEDQCSQLFKILWELENFRILHENLAKI